MDLKGIEKIQFAALGGADNINVGNLTGTDVQQVAIDLGAAGGVGDDAADTVTVNGTGGNDHIKLVGGDQVTVNGLQAQVMIDHVETLDKLVVQGGAGDDIIDASGTPAGGMQFIMNGGDGNDVLHGGQGDDLLTGAAGADRFGFPGSMAPTRSPTSSKASTRSISLDTAARSISLVISLATSVRSALIRTSIWAVRLPGLGASICRIPRWRRSAHPTLRSSSGQLIALSRKHGGGAPTEAPPPRLAMLRPHCE